jgi:hypothetical protein
VPDGAVPVGPEVPVVLQHRLLATAVKQGDCQCGRFDVSTGRPYGAPRCLKEHMMAFADNLKDLPKVSHLAALKLLAEDGTEVAQIENKPGQAGSLAVYNHLAQLYGAITPDAARKGLDLYAEHTEDALRNPGKHPNIDRLVGLAERGETLRVKQVFEI